MRGRSREGNGPIDKMEQLRFRVVANCAPWTDSTLENCHCQAAGMQPKRVSIANLHATDYAAMHSKMKLFTRVRGHASRVHEGFMAETPPAPLETFGNYGARTPQCGTAATRSASPRDR